MCSPCLSSSVKNDWKFLALEECKRICPAKTISGRSSFTRTVNPTAVKSDPWYPFPSSVSAHKGEPFLLPVSLSPRLFVGELVLTVPSVAIQLWSRAVLQGCHDRINENNIAESHFIHITGERNLFYRKMSALESTANTGIQNRPGTNSSELEW